MRTKSFLQCSLLMSAAAVLALSFAGEGSTLNRSAARVAEFAGGDQPHRKYHRECQGCSPGLSQILRWLPR